MFANPNPKVIGAFVVGFALIAGAYTISSFKKPETIEMAAVVAVEAPPRVTIAVTDEDENGIEDWRDEFATAAPVMLDAATTSDYVFPTTYTGRLGIDLIEGVIRARSAGPFGSSDEEIVDGAVDYLIEETAISLYDTKHISIMKNWGEQDVRNYGNAMAGAILSVKTNTTDYELDILNDIVSRGKTERVAELAELASGYKTLRDITLTIPVPVIFVKQHLDLINTYNALYQDIDGMTKSNSDPVVALLSTRRYQDDALGLQLALQNMYASLEPYTKLFSGSDAATYFATFSDNAQNQ